MASLVGFFGALSKRIWTFINRWQLLLFIFLAILVILPGLGTGSLRDWDEAIYAQISKEIVQSGDWITLSHGYHPFFEKPPLLMWLTALFFQFFGVNEFWSRATSAIAGILLVWITVLSGEALFERRTGFLAGLILLGCYGFVFEARNGETDMLLSLFVSGGIFAYLRLKSSGPKWWYVIWIAFALAFMVKSWAASVLPATLGFALLLDGRAKETLRNKHFWLGMLLAFLIVAPWHFLVYIENGKAFLDTYIGRDLLRRMLTPMEGHFGTPLFYLDVLRRVFSPWYFLFPFAFVFSIQEILDGKKNTYVVLIEILLIFGLYTFVAKTKNPSYIFPIFPALSILVARFFSIALSAPKSINSACIITVALIATTVVHDKLIILGILVLCGFLILIKMGLLSKRDLPRISTSLIFAIFFLTNVVSYISGNHRLPVSPLYRMRVSPIAQLATIAGVDDSPTPEPLIGFAMQEDWDSDWAVEGPTATFYSNRSIKVVYTWDALVESMAARPSAEILIAKKYLPQLLGEYQVLIIHEEYPLVYARLRH